MSSEIWQIAQNTKAKDMYDDCSIIRTGIIRAKSEIFAVQQLTKVCSAMNEDLEKDQNKYEIDISNFEEEFNSFKNDKEAEISRLKNEITALEKKRSNGTITEDEQQELSQKQEQYMSLSRGVDNKFDATQTKIKAEYKELGSKKEIAKDYGSLTVEKGQPFADIKEKEGGPWNWGANLKKKMIGIEAVTVGNELLEKVNQEQRSGKK